MDSVFVDDDIVPQHLETRREDDVIEHLVARLA
jgi:hypothetical protein